MKILYGDRGPLAAGAGGAAKPPARPTPLPAGKTAGAGVAAPAAEAFGLTPAQKWAIAMSWVLPATKFGATVLSLLLLLTILFSVLLSLVGRLGGISPLISAFFWSLILFVMLMPWQQILSNGSVACGSLYNLGELLTARMLNSAPDASWHDQTLYLARFLVYPSVGVLVWLVVHLKYGRGCMRMDFPHDTSTTFETVASQALDDGDARRPDGAARAAGTTGKPAARERSGMGTLASKFFRARSGK
jgi:hypothetical protein